MADSEGSTIAPRGLVRMWHAFRWSMNGLRQCWRLESSFRLEVWLFLPLAPLGWWLGGGPVERILLIGCMVLLITAEVMNSAIEAVVDRWGPEWHELAGRAKDMGSAAVFLLILNVVFTWAVLLWPRFMG
jgi:diacylglycerol kinase (ATP)